jgi:hypothetical protein
MGRVTVVIALALAIITAALGYTVSRSPITVASVRNAGAVQILVTARKLSACQAGEALPGGTSAIRLAMFAYTGPRVTVQVREQGSVITSGEAQAGWTGGSVTVPVRSLSTSLPAVDVCFTAFLNGNEKLHLRGEQTSDEIAARSNGEPLSGRMRVEYMRPGRSSWLSLAPEVARRMGLGRAASGTGNVIFVAIVMAAVGLLSLRLLSRELR